MSAAVVQVTVALGASREEVVERAAWPLGGLEALMASEVKAGESSVAGA